MRVLAQVVHMRVDIDRASHDAGRPSERRHGVREDHVRYSVLVARYVSKVTDMPDRRSAISVHSGGGVEMGPGRLAAVGQVSLGVHVHAVHVGAMVTCARIHLEPSDVHVHVQILAFFLLPEADKSVYWLLLIDWKGSVGSHPADCKVVLCFG